VKRPDHDEGRALNEKTVESIGRVKKARACVVKGSLERDNYLAV